VLRSGLGVCTGSPRTGRGRSGDMGDSAGKGPGSGQDFRDPQDAAEDRAGRRAGPGGERRLVARSRGGLSRYARRPPGVRLPCRRSGGVRFSGKLHADSRTQPSTLPSACPSVPTPPRKSRFPLPRRSSESGITQSHEALDTCRSDSPISRICDQLRTHLARDGINRPRIP